MELFGDTFDLIGKLLIGFTALKVHWRVLNEHSIDNIVLSSMKREQMLGILGIASILIGYLLKHSSLFFGFWSTIK